MQIREVKKFLGAVVLACAILVSAVVANADSLWNEQQNLFTDWKASAVGDTIYVNVRESVDAKDEGKTDLSVNMANDVEGGRGFLDIINAFGIGGNSTYKGEKKLERKEHLNTKIACLVVEVLPNGNLIIQGDKYLTTAAEKMNVRFMGVVAPRDIDRKNVVQSDRVANAELVVTGKGSLSRTQRPGLISQVLQAIL